jgi:hypothetical protein
MQFRYLKDLAIALLFISLLAFAIRLVTYNSKSTKVPDQSKYTNESVSDTLRNRIMSIEKSILERKNTVFTVAHDPLRQGNIIKDRFDLAKEFESALRNTFRPTEPISTRRPGNGWSLWSIRTRSTLAEWAM